MQNKYLSLLEKIICISSVSRSEEALGEFMFNYLKDNVQYDHLEKQYIDHKRFNIILTKGKPNIFFSTHLDTVPGEANFRYNNGKIYGRGACDAKGQIITQLWAIETLVQEGLNDYGILLVVGEEIDSIGAKTAIKSNLVKAALLLNGEPTDCCFASSSWGVIEITLKSIGEARHSSVKEAKSAIEFLCRDIMLIVSLNNKELSINIGEIEGGIASNVVADHASAKACIRFTGETSKVIDLINSTVKYSSISIEDIIPEFRFYKPDLLGIKTKDVLFCSDAPLFHDSFDKIMMFGPGSIKYAHANDEHINIADILNAKNVICNVISNMFLNS